MFIAAKTITENTLWKTNQHINVVKSMLDICKFFEIYNLTHTHTHTVYIYIYIVLIKTVLTGKHFHILCSSVQ